MIFFLKLILQRLVFPPECNYSEFQYYNLVYSHKSNKNSIPLYLSNSFGLVLDMTEMHKLDDNTLQDPKYRVVPNYDKFLTDFILLMILVVLIIIW